MGNTNLYEDLCDVTKIPDDPPTHLDVFFYKLQSGDIPIPNTIDVRLDLMC